MAVYADFNGERIELTGAAEEATMKKILEAIQDQPGSATGAAAGGAAGTAAGMLSMGKNLNLLNVGFKALSLGIGFATGSLKLFSSGIAGAAKLGTNLISAQPAVTDLTKSLENLPWIFGDLGSAVHAVTQLLYKNYTTFQQLTTSGIAFGDRLEIMTRFGTRAGVSLDMIAGQLTANSESFAFLGTATRGASMAIEANAQAFEANKDMLQRFGLSFEEQTESFMRFFSLNALGLARETMSRDQLTVMSGNYAKAMRRLSELTGKQADQLQEGIDRANMNRAFQNELAKMPADVRNRFGIILDTVQAGFGDAGREAMMASMLGIAPVTDEAATMLSLNRDFGSLLTNLNSSARSFNGNLQMFGDEVNSQMTGFANSNRGYADANSKLFAALGLSGDAVGGAGSQLIYGINLFSGRITEVASNLGATSPLQEAFNSLNTMIQRIRNTLDETFVQILTSTDFQNGLTAFNQFLSDFNDDVKRQGLINTIVDLFQDLMIAMKRSLNESGWMGDLMVRDSSIAEGSENQLRSDMDRDRELAIEQMALKLGRGETVDTSSLRNEAERDLLIKLVEQVRQELQNANNNLGANLNIAPMGAINIPMEDILGADVMNQIDSNNQTIRSMNTILNQLEDMQFSGGTPGKFGTLFHDFGTGTLGVMHGYESIVTKDQMNSIVAGAVGAGAASVANTQPQNTSDLSQIETGLSRMANRMVDNNREGNVKLIEALNMLAGKMETQNSLTRQVISTVEQYS